MDDLIDRKYILGGLKAARMLVKDQTGLDLLERHINNAPAVVPPGKHGAWIPHPNKEFREWDVCTVCGTGTKRREYGLNPDGREWVSEKSYRHCPWCGAKMDSLYESLKRGLEEAIAYERGEVECRTESREDESNETD